MSFTVLLCRVKMWVALRQAAVNLARAAALRRVALVLLDGRCRWAVALPQPEDIETSLVWDARVAGPKPDRSTLPSRCSGGGGGDDDFDSVDGGESRSDEEDPASVGAMDGGSGGAANDAAASGAGPRVRRNLRRILRGMDQVTPAPRDDNWRLGRALRQMASDEPSAAALFIDGIIVTASAGGKEEAARRLQHQQSE